MPGPPVYRYDPEEHEEGKVLTSRGDHIVRLRGSQLAVEQALRNTSERTNIRATSLYVWRHIETAEKLWKLTTDGQHLYELEIDPNDIRQVGDVALYTLAMQCGPQEPAIDALVRLYWNQIPVESRVEILVSKAIVRKKLFDNSKK